MSDDTQPVNVPPADLDAEGAVLSFALCNGRHAFPELKPKHFYADANRWIYEAIVSLAESEKPIDAVAVARWLMARGDESATRLSQVGGTTYIATLRDCIPASAETFARAHAAAIIEAWKMRVLIAAFQTATAKLYAWQLNSEGAWEFVKDVVRGQRA